VDQDGVVLDILVQPRQDGQAAKRFFKRLLNGSKYEPRVIVTDKLKSYGVALRQFLPRVEHRRSRYLNNRSENSHRPTRRRERQMQRFTRAGAGFPFGSRIYPWSLPSTPSPDPRQDLSRDSFEGFQGLAAGDVRPVCCVIGAISAHAVSSQPAEVNVTMPMRQHYSHLDLAERRQIAPLVEAKVPVAEIARRALLQTFRPDPAMA
jgi:hypothetical protein